MSLYCGSMHLHSPTDFFFSKFTQSETRRNQHRRRRRHRKRSRGGEGVPQRQRKVSWLALPAQRGEDTSGHVEPSCVLSRPLTPTPGFSLWHTVRASEQNSRKNVTCKVTTSVYKGQKDLEFYMFCYNMAEASGIRPKSTPGNQSRW